MMREREYLSEENIGDEEDEDGSHLSNESIEDKEVSHVGSEDEG